jgi:opacity protein-like surface antigen
MIVLLALAASAAPALAQEPAPPAAEPGFRPRIVREGTVSLHGGAMYGKMLGGGRFADVFSSGLGAGFGLRYRTDRNAALGLGFESHFFDAKDQEPDSVAAPKSLQVIVTTLDYYHYSNVRGRTPRYWMVGAGLAQTRQVDFNDEREFPGDGGVFKLGGGVEYWLSRTITAELGIRYYGVFSQSELNHDLQGLFGVAFYTSP